MRAVGAYRPILSGATDILMPNPSDKQPRSLWLGVRRGAHSWAFEFPPGRERAVVVGSLLWSEVCIPSPRVAPVHFYFKRDKEDICLVPAYRADLCINGSAMRGPTIIHDAAVVEFSGERLEVLVSRRPGAASDIAVARRMRPGPSTYQESDDEPTAVAYPRKHHNGFGPEQSEAAHRSTTRPILDDPIVTSAEYLPDSVDVNLTSVNSGLGEELVTAEAAYQTRGQMETSYVNESRTVLHTRLPATETPISVWARPVLLGFFVVVIAIGLCVSVWLLR